MPSLEKWTPFRELDLLDRNVRGPFRELGVTAVTPAADIYETGSELVVGARGSGLRREGAL